MASKSTLRRFLPTSLSKTMNSTYSSLSKEDEVDITTTSYTDEDLKSPSSSTPTLLPNHEEHSNPNPSSSDSPLRKQFIYLVITSILILLTTILIVRTGTSSCRKSQPQPQIKTPALAPPLSAEEEYQKALSLFPSPLHPPKNYTTCGPNAATAITKGCHLDLISFTWLPHECYDPTLTEDFLALAPWQYSHDQNGTSLITAGELKRGEVNRGYVKWEYHLTHCLYTWKKLVRHLERGGAMDWYVMEFSHVRHCSGLLEEGIDAKKGEWNSEFFVQFPLCGFA